MILTIAMFDGLYLHTIVRFITITVCAGSCAHLPLNRDRCVCTHPIQRKNYNNNVSISAYS